MDLPENKLTEFIQDHVKAQWKPVNNHNITIFTEDDIKRITKNYTTPIGQGSFGQVYRGILDDGTVVAVKKYIQQNSKEGFAREVTVHCQINHKNVVRLLGYCAEENALTMVTAFISRGNLDNLLHSCDDPVGLGQRLCIAIDCAEALRYMHSWMYQPIIHGDIKPANILLDDNLAAKLADFGISRLLSVDRTQYTLNVIGSRGYVDPEFLLKGRIDPKNDVYSFGVILLELITRKKACQNGMSTDLTENFMQAIAKGKNVREIFDTEITNASNMKIVDKIGKLAADCLRRKINERPEIKYVLERLYKLIETYHQGGQKKTGKWSLWGTEKINRDSTVTSSSNSTLLTKVRSFDIFNRTARYNFEKNGGPLFPKCSINLFKKKELKKILKNSTIIGSGPSGEVFKGYLSGNNEPVVLKKIDHFNTSLNGHFAHVVLLHSSIIHKNIVRIIGCCVEVDIPILVYEYVPRGSLDDILHYKSRSLLDLDERLNIAVESAEGLAYMHLEYSIRHGCFKPADILLDNNLVPKISGFGISVLRAIYTTRHVDLITGDKSYMDPVYLKSGVLPMKCDVYSFGVVLLELITRKKATYSGKNSLVQNFLESHKQDKGATKMFDTEIIATKSDMELLDSIAAIAVKCLNLDMDQRPEMTDIAKHLRLLKLSRN